MTVPLVVWLTVAVKEVPGLGEVFASQNVRVYLARCAVRGSRWLILSPGGPEPNDRTVLAISSAARHPAIALAIATANFPDQTLAPAAVVLYLLVSLIAAAPYSLWRKRVSATPRFAKP